MQRDEKNEIIKQSDGYPLLKQKGVDMALGIDGAKLATTKQINRVILVAGDSDFVPAITAAKLDGVLVTLYYSPQGVIHDSLYESCDDRIEITEDILQKYKRERRIRK